MGIVNAGNLPNYDDIDAELLRHIENLIWNRGTDAVEELLRIGQQMELLVDGGGSEEDVEEWRLLPPDERLQFSLIKVVCFTFLIVLRKIFDMYAWFRGNK